MMQYRNIHINDFPDCLVDGGRVIFYYIFLLKGKGRFFVDFTEYICENHSLLFLSPYQYFQWKENPEQCDFIAFHGDFYCIEYHQKEVACNGLLFNNIYQKPVFNVSKDVFEEILSILNRMKQIVSRENPYQISVLKSYLQLILALSSREKQQFLSDEIANKPLNNPIGHFQDLLEMHFIKEREVSFYAQNYHLSQSTFSKRIKEYFGKTPTELIRERVVLEAKKKLHLTHKSVKEIADELCFEDVFYFSRYFKKETGVSPKQFRESVGISVVAK